MPDFASTEEMRGYLTSIVASQEYMLERTREEFAKLESSDLTPLDLLTIRAFIHSYAGMHEAAIADLNAIAGRKEGQTARVLNKLAQELLRSGAENNVEQVHAISERVISLPASSSGERWLAYHNMALAHLAKQDLSNAETYEKKALSEVNDPRSHTVLEFIRSSRVPDSKNIAFFAAELSTGATTEGSQNLSLSTTVGFFAANERSV